MILHSKKKSRNTKTGTKGNKKRKSREVVNKTNKRKTIHGKKLEDKALVRNIVYSTSEMHLHRFLLLFEDKISTFSTVELMVKKFNTF